MNRRGFVKALLPAVAVPIVAKLADGSEAKGVAVGLEKGRRYMFVINREHVFNSAQGFDALCEALEHFGVDGQIFLSDDPENFCRIYELTGKTPETP